MFLGPDGKPMPKRQAIVSGRSAGVPGAIAMLYLAQAEHGKLAWKDLFGDAERLADRRLPGAGPRWPRRPRSRAPQASQPDAIAYFTKPDGTKVKAGDIMKNPAYAATLRKIAAEGPKAHPGGPDRRADRRQAARGPDPRHHDAGGPGELQAQGRARRLPALPRSTSSARRRRRRAARPCWRGWASWRAPTSPRTVRTTPQGWYLFARRAG